MGKGRSISIVLALALGLALSLIDPALAGVSTEQVSVTRTGGDPKGNSLDPSISADGRYVAFASNARDLVRGDHSPWRDVFVRDVLTGTTVRASVDSEGGDPDNDSDWPSISADGRYVAFNSGASDLVVGQTGISNIFVRDLVAGITVLATVHLGGGDLHLFSYRPSISADGRYVAFDSESSDLVVGDENSYSDVFVRDLVAGITVRASVDTEGGDPEAHSDRPSISGDGRYVAYSSWASDLVFGDRHHYSDIFVRDLVAGTTVRASVNTQGRDPNWSSYNPSITPDGRYVAFESGASDLVAGDGNGTGDIFVRDLVAGTTVRASVDTGEGDPDGVSYTPSISSDGRYVAFWSYASDLVAGDGNGTADIFVRDLVAGTTIRASVDAGGGDPNDYSQYPSISADGGYVAFESYASDLLPGRGDKPLDVFLATLS